MSQFYDTIVNKYGVDGIDGLLGLSEEDVEKWKAIPIGYRIKVKKLIAEHKSRNKGSEDQNNTNANRSENEGGNEKKEKNMNNIDYMDMNR